MMKETIMLSRNVIALRWGRGLTVKTKRSPSNAVSQGCFPLIYIRETYLKLPLNFLLDILRVEAHKQDINVHEKFVFQKEIDNRFLKRNISSPT